MPPKVTRPTQNPGSAAAEHYHLSSGSGGSLSLPEKVIRLEATAASASHSATWLYTKMNDDIIVNSSASARSSGWIEYVNGQNGRVQDPYIEMRLPFGVVIGDSIAEGHNDLHGRLHPNGAASYDANYANAQGQLSYELGTLTSIPWYNHGISGQTSSTVWARWRRDVLAETYDPGDGRGSSTLSTKPYVVLVASGVNDSTNSVSLDTSKQNMRNMAISLRDNGIHGVFLGIGQRGGLSAAQLQQNKDLTSWMVTELPKYGARVVEWYAWSAGAGTPDTGSTGIYSDGLHPHRAGYNALARWILLKIYGFPIFLRGFLFDTSIDAAGLPADMARAKTVEVKVNSNVVHVQTLPNRPTVFIPALSIGDGFTARFTVRNHYVLAGGGIYQGVSGISAVLSSIPGTKPFSHTADSATFSGDGSTTAFTIKHLLGVTPTAWHVQAEGDESSGDYYVTADATNLTVTFKTAPVSGASNVKFRWSALGAP